MWSAVELREIRVFLVLCEELHFGHAADRLHLTSSRVSQVIRTLESKVGGQLLERTSRRVELTDLGERFRDEVGRGYQEIADALHEFQARSRSQDIPLRLGLFCDPAVSRIPRIVKAFERTYPWVAVEAAEVPIDEPLGPLRRAELDLVAAWLPLEEPGLVVGPILSSEPRVLAVAADHPLAARGEISVEELAEYRVMRFDTMPKAFHEAWIPSRTPGGRPIPHLPFSRRSLGDRGRMTSELLHMIALGRVVHPTVPSFAHMFSHPDVVHVRIADMPPLRSGLVWCAGTRDPRVQDFARIAAQVAGRPSDETDDRVAERRRRTLRPRPKCA